MSRLTLSVCCGSYDRTRALFDGSVKAKGIDLKCTAYTPPPDDLFRRTLQHMEYDVSELSLSSYFHAHSIGLPLIAIPVFPSRKFRHYHMYGNVNSVRKVQDLKGKKVGCAPSYYTTAAVWQRGILQHEYGIKPSQLTWYTEKAERLKFYVPKDVQLKIIEGGIGALNPLLESGEIDAMIGPRPIPTTKTVKHLFDDPLKEERDYFKRTRIYPIMHTIVVKESVMKENPWVATSLLDAFSKAKEVWKRYTSSDFGGLAWASPYIQEEERVLGQDPYPYGIKGNRKVLETLIQYSVEQGVLKKKIKIEELFPPNTLDT